MTFLGKENLEGDNIRRQYLSKILPLKLILLTKDVPTRSEFLLINNLNDRIGTIETSQKMLRTYSHSPYYKNSKNLQRFPKSPGNQNKRYNSNSQTRGYNNQKQTTTGESKIAVPQEKLSCSKAGTTTILKFQQEIIPILKRDIQNFRGGNLKNHLTKWKNVTSDKTILDIIENGLKLDLIDIPKSNSKFAFPLSHEEEL